VSQHYLRSTVQASSWCRKCNGFTPHRIDDARVGPCLNCLATLSEQSERAASVEPAPQLGLFGGAGPVHAPTREVSPSTAAKIERIVALAGAGDATPELFDVAGETVAEAVVSKEPVLAAAEPASALWMSDDVLERAVALHESAKFWRGQAETVPAIADEAAQYATNLDKLAADMECRPDFYRQKPGHVSDWQWWQKGEAAA
jgi:hypothetical protein